MTDDLAGQIRRNLWTITDLYDEALEPVRRAAGSHVTTSKEPPLPIAATVLDVRAEAHRDLHYWARFLLDNIRNINGDLLTHRFEDTEPKTLVGFIVTWVDILMRDYPDDADNLASDADGHVRELRKIAHPDPRPSQSLGACPLDVDSEEGPVRCGGKVLVRQDDEATQGKCNGCGVVAVVQWWERVIMPEASRLITAAEVPEFIRQQFGKAIKEPTVRKWIQRGWIESAGADDRGRTLYDKGAVAYAIARREGIGA